MRDRHGAPFAILETNNEISERKRAEEALTRLNRELRAIGTCNQVLLRATDEQSLLKQVCRIVCEEAGYSAVWVGYAEHDEGKSVRPVAHAGNAEDYLEKRGVTWADTERGRGIAGTRRRWTRGALVTAEVALSLVLLVGAGLMVRTLVWLNGLNPGFDTHNVVAAEASMQDARYQTAAAVNRLLSPARSSPPSSRRWPRNSWSRSPGPRWT